MKKLYIFFLPVFTIALISCMELQQKQEDKKPQLSMHTLLQTESHKDSIEKLYENTFTFISKVENFSYKNVENKFLIFLIKSMEEMQNNGIGEDHMSMYAYHKCDWISDSGEKQRIPLFFGCLKKYRLTIMQTKEILPIAYYHEKPSIEADLLFSAKYPAYYSLINGLACLCNLVTLKDVLVFLYSKKRMSFHHYPENSHIDIRNEFYPKVNFLLDMSVLELNNNLDTLYNVLQIIDKVKLAHSTINETKLGAAILKLDLTPSNTLTTAENIAHQKNRVSLFCSLVQKYNEKKAHKKTPTPQQYAHCFLIDYIDLALPDFFDATLVDTTTFAFKEFKKLLTRIVQLIQSPKEIIQQRVIDTYLQKK